MKIRIGVFGLLLGMALSAISPWRLYGEDKVYTVQRGETFYSIARAFGVKVDDLMKHNGIADPAKLQAGQRLRIPGASQAAGAASNGAASGGAANSGAANRGAAPNAGTYTDYRVVRGDTFYGIARKYSLTVDAIRKANSLEDDYTLRAGDSLRIPVETVAEAPRERAPSNPAPAAPAPAPIPASRAAAPGQGSRTRVEPRETEAGKIDPSVRWPVAARELSYMTGKLSGVVIAGLKDEAVKSLTFGSVLSAGPFQGFGRVVIIQVEGGYLYVYGGCESLSVKEGDKVGPGTELGKLGIDAVSNKPQLFFMVYRSNNPIDPAKAPRA